MDEVQTMSILETAETWAAEGRKLAIATVIETWGSAPQPVGSQLVVDADGNFEGAVSGGCVEGDVITEAQGIIAGGGHKVLSYGVADETAWKVGLACGGKIRVLVEAVT
jgi:xanthine/CO dehydrogenase XdhC/CoxF family maturation factor